MNVVNIMKDKIIKFIKDPEIWAYLIVGILTTIVAMIVKLGLLYTVFSQRTDFQILVAEVIAWIVAVAFAYITNRIFVFKSKSKQYLKEIISFVSGRIFTLLVGMFVMWFICSFLKLNDDTWVFIATMIDQVVVSILNYVVSKIFVFKK